MAWRDNKNIEELCNILKTQSEIIVFDIETTGLSRAKCRLIQISGIKYVVDNVTGKLQEKEIIDTYINPEMKIPPKITEITGITDEMVKNSPTEKEAFEKVIKPFFGNSPVLSGYNSRTFDIPVMKEVYLRQGEKFNPVADTDVIQLARDFLVNEKLKDRKLATVANFYGVDAGLTFHNSLDDVRATARLLMYFNTEAKKRMSEIEARRAFRLVPKIKDIVFWQGYRGHSRIYVKTNCGDFYYDAYGKNWGVSKKNIYSEEEINMEQLQKDARKMYDVESDEELFKKVKMKSSIA